MQTLTTHHMSAPHHHHHVLLICCHGAQTHAAGMVPAGGWGTWAGEARGAGWSGGTEGPGGGWRPWGEVALTWGGGTI